MSEQELEKKLIEQLSSQGYEYKPGDIILEIQKSNDIIRLVVEDNGVGFDEEKLSKEEGGMGLFIARTIADDFKIEKKLNGTLFRVEKKVKEAE